MSPGLAKRVSTTTPNSTSTTATSPSNAANLKIQNALERNMKKLNLVGPNQAVKNSANLTKEDIELFTNSNNNNNGNFAADSLQSTPEHHLISNIPLNNNNNVKNNHNNSILIPDATSYYLNRLPNTNIISNNASLGISKLGARNSVDREMTPDSIDNSKEYNNPNPINKKSSTTTILIIQ